MSKDFTNRQGGGQKLNRLRRKVGAVLIEFAFAIPVFLILLYYIHDLPKQKLMQRKMQFVANEMAAILQNIAVQKNGNGKISQNDIFNAARLAWLSVFPGLTQYNPDKGSNSYTARPTGYMPMIFLYYIAGTADNNAEIKWNCRFYPADVSELYRCNANQTADSIIKIRSGAPSAIHPDLQLKKGEVKILIECSLYSDPEIYFSSTKQSTKNMPKRKIFGFLFYNPVSKEPSRKYAYFTAVSIFSPIGTAFPKRIHNTQLFPQAMD